MIILDIEKPHRCGECPMHNDGNDYCKLAHDHASFVRAKGCPIRTVKIDKIARDIADEIKQELIDSGAFIGRWISVSERLPNNHEYIKNNGLFSVSDGNRSYFGWFDIDTKKFVKPTIAGFLVDNAVIAWMPYIIPEPYNAESEDKK